MLRVPENLYEKNFNFYKHRGRMSLRVAKKISQLSLTKLGGVSRKILRMIKKIKEDLNRQFKNQNSDVLIKTYTEDFMKLYIT